MFSAGPRQALPAAFDECKNRRTWTENKNNQVLGAGALLGGCLFAKMSLRQTHKQQISSKTIN